MARNPFPKGSTEAAMWDYENATNEYLAGGFEDYSWLEDFTPEELAGLPYQEASGLANIQMDQGLNDMELMALADLEAQSKDGLSARDQAELAKVEMNANRANAGRQGAIRQEMASRGLGGSGLDFMARQQSAQDAFEMEALAGLERAAMSQEGRRDATSRMGAMAGNMSERDYARKAQAAQAQDIINRFNTGNEINRRVGNNQMRNDGRMFNIQGRQGVANNNTGAQNNWNQNALTQRQGISQLQYNDAVDRKNMEELKRREREKKRKGQMGAVLGVAGGIAGGVMTGGNPMGAAVGYQAGNAMGQSFAYGGEVEGEAPMPGDHPMNDVVDAKLSPGEVVIPRTMADDPDAARDFVAELSGESEDKGADKAVQGLLEAMNYLNRKKR